MPRGRQPGETTAERNEKGGRPVDVHVGSRVRLRRTLCGLSQEKLGDAIGLTFQQVQKYERGANRISASRLFALSQVLDVPVSFFFDDVSDALAQGSPADTENPRSADGVAGDVMFRRETLELVRAYYKIADDSTRRALYHLVKATADAECKKPERTTSKQVAAAV
jgi:transcriptional regulator with XRE-family HTH domain